MTDSTDSQALSSAHKDIAVAEPSAGMLVAGYVVLVFPKETEAKSVFYGPFKNLDTARRWAEMLTGLVIIHPIHEATANRG